MSGRPIDVVIDALTTAGCNPRRAEGEDQWSARCPAHDDKSPSLSAGVGREDCAVLTCHATCDVGDVLKALNLEMRDLYVKVHGNSDGARSRISATYAYVDEDGAPLFEAVRFTPKAFRQRRPDGNGEWVWNLNGTRRVLYRLPAVLAAVANGERVWIGEGEKDCDALTAAGVVATCNPMGAGKWSKVPDADKVLAGADIVIVADKDDAGRRHAADIVFSLTGVAQRVAVVEAARGKDAADHLAAGLGLDDFVPVALDDLEAGDRDENFKPVDDDGKRHVVLTPASAIKVRPVHWVWKGRIPVGALTLLGGREGIGKSTLMYQLIADITRGQLDGHYSGQARAVIVAATEDSWEHTIVPRLMGADADLDLVFRADVVSSEGVDTNLTLPADLHALEDEARQVGAAAIVLDPLLSRLHASLDTHKDAEVRIALEPLVALADRCGAAVVGLIHVNKGTSTDPLTLLMGSRAFAAVARAVMFVMKSPDDDELRLVGQPKNNLGRTDQPTLQFTIVSKRVAETDEGDVWTGAIRWEGESERSISDYLEEGAEGSAIHTAAGEAAEWLYDYLLTQGGSALSKDCKDAGGKVGHTHAALKRACKKLHVETRSEGFPRVTWWSVRQSAHLPGESKLTELIEPTERDQGRRLRPVGSVGPVGAVGSSPREGAPTGLACERCSTTSGRISFCGTASQTLCSSCWVYPPATTGSELF